MVHEQGNDHRTTNTRSLIGLTTNTADRPAIDALFEVAQRELTSLACRLMRDERGSHTLEPAALVNEAYLRLFDVQQLTLAGRAHFLNLAARAMRQVLVEYARRKNSAKRGGGWRAVTLTGQHMREVRDEVNVIAMNDALRKLAVIDPRAASVVEKRVFGGLTMSEIADLLGLSRRTVQKDWRFATLWLRREFAEIPGE